MPEAVLAGPDGQPAIDQMTGMPLTMEELLRRRGMLSVGGTISPFDVRGSVPTRSDPAMAAEQALAGAAAATTANSTGSTAAIGASADTVGVDGAMVGATPATPQPIVDEAALAGAEVQPTSTDDPNFLPWLAAGAGAAGLAYGASKLRRNPITGVEEVVTEGSPEAGRALAARRVGPTVNPNLQRMDNETQGSNRALATTIDGKNVSNAGEIGAGPKSLSGTAPVTDVTGDNPSLTSALVERGLPDYYAPGTTVRSRMQTGAAQANNSRVQPPGTTPIQVRDRFTDLSPDELETAKVLAGRMMSDRSAGLGKAPNRIGSTAIRKGRIANSEMVDNPIRAPDAEAASVFQEAVNRVRALKSQSLPTNLSTRVPRVRIR